MSNKRKNIFRLIRIHLLMFFLFLAFLSTHSSAFAKLLIGGVQQSDYLSAITPQISGAIDKGMACPQVEWFQIPKWMAGHWTKEGDITVSTVDLRTGAETPVSRWMPNHMTRQFGHQLDVFGNVWWAVLVPVENDSESQKVDSTNFRFVTIALTLEKNTADELVTRSRYLVTESSIWGVSKQYQQEAINHYMVADDGGIQNNSYNRIFDLNGRAIRDARLISKWKKTDEFIPVAEFQGIDLAKSLNYYLCMHGQTSLARADVTRVGLSSYATSNQDNSNSVPASNASPNDPKSALSFP